MTKVRTQSSKNAAALKAAVKTKATPSPHKRGWFAVFAQATSNWTGSAMAFCLAVTTIFVWIVSGPIFKFSDTWQLVINTGTTIITFLMVFLIQNSQNRDSKVIQLKLDELIRAIEGAEDALINLEDMTEAELEDVHAKFANLAHAAGDSPEQAA